MPSRRRPKSPKSPEHEGTDPVAQFAAGLRASAEREAVQHERARQQRQQARDAAKAAADHAASLAGAQRELDRTITAARAARRAGRSDVAAADEAWRLAKARLIELQTGAPPDWARRNATVASDEVDAEP